MSKFEIRFWIPRIEMFYLCVLCFFIPISKATIEVCFGFLMILFLLKTVMYKEERAIFKDPSCILLLIFVISGLASFKNTMYFSKSVRALFSKWLEYIMFYLFTFSFFVNKKTVKKKYKIAVFSVFAISCVLVGVDGIAQLFTGKDFLRGKMIGFAFGDYVGVNGSFNHHNDLGAYLLLPLGLLLGALAFCKNRKLRYFSMFVVPLLLMVLFFTMSRGAWLGFAVLFILLAAFDKRKTPYIVILGVCVVFFLFVPALRERVLLSFSAGGSNTRNTLWLDSLRMWAKYPFFGIGIGTYMDEIGKYSELYKGTYAHNSFLQILVEQGLFGFLSFTAFCALVLKNAFGKLKAMGDSEKDKWYAVGAFVGISGYTVHSFFDTHLYSLTLAVLFWSFMGLVRAMTLKNE